jgi:phosphatidylinositol 4-kinase
MNGKIIHIDFGFILGISPGKINFETAPFKLTKEYIEILDGEQSSLYYYFKTLLIRLTATKLAN